MGARARFTKISEDMHKALLRGVALDMPSAAIRHSIDKAWIDFHGVFSDRDYPLCLAITGDGLHPESPHTLEDFLNGDYDWYLGLASPRLVRDASLALTDLPTTLLQQWYDEGNCGDYDVDYYLFAELKSAYAKAAEQCSGLMILIC